MFRDDLKRTPHNGRSVFGLSEALRAQGKASEATTQAAAFASEWAHADTQLSVGAL